VHGQGHETSTMELGGQRSRSHDDKDRFGSSSFSICELLRAGIKVASREKQVCSVCVQKCHSNDYEFCCKILELPNRKCYVGASKYTYF